MPWVSGVAVGLGAYDAATGQMIKTALRGSLVWRLQAGIRPWKDAHWYFEAGYCSVLLGGSVATPGSVATFLRPPASGIPIPPSYTIDAKVHMASVEVGYEHDYANHVQVRVAFGFSGAFAADVTVQMPGFGSNEYVHRVEDSLAGLLRSYSFTPTLTLSGGFWAR
jgi:hypothetical protein